LDSIHNVKELSVIENEEKISEYINDFIKNLWGVSFGSTEKTEHIEMDINICCGDEHILNRLEREKRNGKIEKIDECTYRFSADIYDATEMLPWIRTFTGRIERLYCSDKKMVELFYSDVDKMKEIYGGDEDAVF